MSEKPVDMHIINPTSIVTSSIGSSFTLFSVLYLIWEGILFKTIKEKSTKLRYKTKHGSRKGQEIFTMARAALEKIDTHKCCFLSVLTMKQSLRLDF